jgi:hypothetical protein
MTIDIEYGNLLVMNGKDYPVKHVETWSMTRQSAASFSHLATATAQVKKSSIDANGNRTAASLQTQVYKALPLDPLSPEIVKTLEPALGTPASLRQTVISDSASFVLLVVEVLHGIQ